MNRRTMFAALTILTVAFTACSDKDEVTSEGGHTPVSAKLFVNNAQVSTLTIGAGQTKRVEIRFYAADGDEITGIETEHFAALTFTPSSIATTAAVSGKHFSKDVTATAAAGTTGTVMVGYGHAEDADEHAFGPFPVVIN